MNDLGLITDRQHPNAPTFSLKNRIMRVLWQFVWLAAARWTPPPLHLWRVLLLRAFGARVDLSAHIYSSVEIWAPWNLEILAFGSLARNVRCYNIAKISIGYKAIVSQHAYLCTGTHDYRDPAFPLIAKPLSIGSRAWICAGAFVGPGVNVGEGAVLGAAGVAFKDLTKWTVYAGNPAVVQRARTPLKDVAPDPAHGGQ
jgi:putative colanic acid biosynthesis acetyltransferase WcaF